MFDPPKYEDLTDKEVNQQCTEYVAEWNAFLQSEGIIAEKGKDYYIHKKNIFEVIRRRDKRRVYMKMFHDLPEMCEYKVVAIEAYWTLTLKPFLVINENLSIYNCPNEMFALYRILTVIRAAYRKKFGNKEFPYPSKERIQDILYDFKYCRMNRESLVAFIETFADVYGVGISNIFDVNKEKHQNNI